MAGTGDAVGGLERGIPREIIVGRHRAAAMEDAVDDAIDVADAAPDALAQPDADAALHPVGLVGGHAQGKLFRWNKQQHVVDDLLDPGRARQRAGMRAVAFRIGHDTEKIGVAGERGVIVDAGKGAPGIAAGILAGASRHGDAQLFAVVVKGTRELGDKTGKRIALGRRQVLKIELPTDKILGARGRKQSADGAVAGGCRAQQALGAIAGKTGVDDQGHDRNAIAARDGVQIGRY